MNSLPHPWFILVRRVDSLFALADPVEARLAAVQRQVNARTPSLLARASRGRLVPQDLLTAGSVETRIRRQQAILGEDSS
jgi:type I restriction enzyme S subunit